MGFRSVAVAIGRKIDSEAPIKKAAAVTTNHMWATRM
jgi:hypothetical protein